MSQSRLGIWFTTLLALFLVLLPLPDPMLAHNPQWLLLVVFYWLIYAPQKTGLVYAWFWGLLLDVALNTYIGSHALLFTLAAYAVRSIRHRIAVAALLLQAFTIAGITLLYLSISLWLVEGIHSLESTLIHLSRAISNLAAWPLLYFLLRTLR